ncbi:unnamed protein product [Euphydryas editha]|uniref:Peptidase M10 metallopeptidase domain-containing protein n=1 Tax=Euphydryas editha TaxID=104508 RepID=A0AAU9UEB1_EUPED|nr:unnamed protein product [Euphydryas editha]
MIIHRNNLTILHSSLSQVRRPSQLDPHGTRSVLARALDVWEQASRLTFTEVNSDDADIVVSFANKDLRDTSYPFKGICDILVQGITIRFEQNTAIAFKF